MEELELDYIEYEIEETPKETRTVKIKGSTTVPKRGKQCPLCPGKFTHLRRHTLTTHLPWFVAPNTACWRCKSQFAQVHFRDVHVKEVHPVIFDECNFEEAKHGKLWVELMNGFLLTLSESFGYSQVHELCQYVNEATHFKTTCEFSIFQSDDLQFLKLFQTVNHLEDVDAAKPYPAHSLMSLLHWRILSLLRKDSGVKDLLQERRYVLFNPLEVTSYIDSHLHLDQVLKMVGSSDCFQFDPERGSQSKMEYAISNYCFPTSWPSSKRRDKIREDNRVRLTFGIHPRIIGNETQRTIDVWLRDLKYLLKSKKVVAVGECGLDTTDHPNSRQFQKQIKAFVKQLEMGKELNLPVVVHCRGNPDISKTCLELLVENLASNHPVHRHCFTGDFEEYCRWKESLPMCRFGVSPCLSDHSKHPDLPETISKMKLDDIVLESDAPYIKSTLPTVVSELAFKVALLHHKQTDEIADITSRAARELYRLT